MIDLWIPGRPIPQPRMTQKQKYRKEFKNHAVWGWRDRVAYAVKVALPGGPPTRANLLAGFDFHVGSDSFADLKNLVTAVEDCLQGIVYVNDRQIQGYLWPTRIFAVADTPNQGLRLQIAAWEEIDFDKLDQWHSAALIRSTS